ncbi:MAG: hypothetical protein HUJ25_17830 [Crocinitomicaceae bacterium]|nr:hypothetical protein [Crocinitomicaceae bacterium]
MKLKGWLNYPDMTISVHETGGKYRCSKYIGKASNRLNFKDCYCRLDLKYYLLSLANAPKKEITAMIGRLEQESTE